MNYANLAAGTMEYADHNTTATSGFFNKRASMQKLNRKRSREKFVDKNEFGPEPVKSMIRVKKMHPVKKVDPPPTQPQAQNQQTMN